MVGKKLYVGNLTYKVSSSELEQLFSQFGTVQSAQVITDRDTGRSKGFGFVEMDTEAEAQEAIRGLHDQDHNGRRLTVNEARPREPRAGGGGGGYGGSGGGGYGGRRPWRLRRRRWRRRLTRSILSRSIRLLRAGRIHRKTQTPGHLTRQLHAGGSLDRALTPKVALSTLLEQKKPPDNMSGGFAPPTMIQRSASVGGQVIDPFR